jgi:RNA polymerase primary sigma factor
VTHQELNKAIPNAEEDLVLLDEIMGLLMDLGIEIIDAKDKMLSSPETEEPGKEVTPAAAEKAKAKAAADKKPTVELREIANDSIRLYLCEIGRISLPSGPGRSHAFSQG